MKILRLTLLFSLDFNYITTYLLIKIEVVNEI